MKIAINQPYIFPYLGYFQLINAVDTFIFYDDVGFIKQGYINRNNILVNKTKYPFTIPVQNISSFTTIKNTLISEKPAHWNTKLLATFEQTYRKAPHFAQIMPLVDNILRACPDSSSGGPFNRSIGEVAAESVQSVLTYLNVEKRLISSHDRYHNTDLRLSERVIDICRQEKATTYINAIGGQSLYDADFFSKNNVQLRFIKPNLTVYPQNAPTFIQGLSIIDVLMHNDPTTVRTMLNDYTLL
jgi:WbqC-like protein family